MAAYTYFLRALPPLARQYIQSLVLGEVQNWNKVRMPLYVFQDELAKFEEVRTLEITLPRRYLFTLRSSSTDSPERLDPLVEGWAHVIGALKKLRLFKLVIDCRDDPVDKDPAIWTEGVQLAARFRKGLIEQMGEQDLQGRDVDIYVRSDEPDPTDALPSGMGYPMF